MAWLSGWNKRQKLTLTGGSSDAQTDYQIKLTVAYDSDMQADFDDLRFTESDGTTLVDAWLETHTASTTATVWVEFPTTPANTVTEDYYMYYSNSGASSNWSGPNTFLKFDDFNDGNITGWSGQTGSFAASTDMAYDGTHSLNKTGSDSHSNGYIYQTETTTDMEVELRVWNSDTLFKRGGPFISKSGDADNYYALYINPGNSLNLTEFNNGSFIGYKARDLSVTAIASAQWCKYIIRKVGTQWHIYAYNAAGTEIATAGYTSGAFTPGYVGVHFYDQTSYSDQFIARKYATGPATYVFGSEEVQWYDNSWVKRKKITLTGGASGAQTDYQLKITVPYTAAMQGDFDDLRFTKSDNITLIDTWMETHTTSTSATVWVEFPTTPANTITEDYYMYYGNSGAASVSNIWNTGLTGSDDFTDGTSRWTEVSGAISIASDIASTNPTANHGGVRASSGIAMTAGNGIAIHTRQKYADITDTQNAVGFCEHSTTTTWYGYNTLIMRATGAQTRWESWGKSAFDHWAVATLDTDWHIIDIEAYVGSNGIVTVSDETGTKSPIWSIVSDTYYVWLTKAYNTYQASHITETDWILVKKYVLSPATYGFGSEESGPTGNAMWYYKLLQRRNR